MIESREHAELTELLPWYLNGTLERRQRTRLERHLERCAECRADLALEQRLQRHLGDVSAIDYLPAPSLKKLQQRIDALGNVPQEPGAAPAAQQAAGTPAPPRHLRFAIAACGVIALFVALVPHEHALRPGAGAAIYRTVTSSPARAPEETVRAVFAPSVTLLELQKILEEAHLRIVAGPTEAGVYSLAPTSSRPTAASLAVLRRHPEVRFAESTRLEPPVAPPAEGAEP